MILFFFFFCVCVCVCVCGCKLFYLNISTIQLNQAIGSIEAIAKASKEYILENTDLSVEKAERIRSFFRDPKFYLSLKIN